MRSGKRNFHGALAEHSPFRIAPVTCIGPCGQIIESSCEIIPNSRVCHRCWLAGVRDLDEARPRTRA